MAPASRPATSCLRSFQSSRVALQTALSNRSGRSPSILIHQKKAFQIRPQIRHLVSTPPLLNAPSKSHPPKSTDRGPKSTEDTQTDFSTLNMLGNMPVPTTAIDACTDDGFALDSGLKVSNSGVLLIGGDAFKWRPWLRSSSSEGGKLKNSKGQFEVDKIVWGVLDLVWPKPDLLILGTGQRILPLSPQTRREIGEMGVRIEVQDTRNAAAQFNMLATERGTQQVAAALVPVGWRDGK